MVLMDDGKSCREKNGAREGERERERDKNARALTPSSHGTRRMLSIEASSGSQLLVLSPRRPTVCPALLNCAHEAGMERRMRGREIGRNDGARCWLGLEARIKGKWKTESRMSGSTNGGARIIALQLLKLPSDVSS